MRRAGRILFTILSSVSLLLAVTIVVLWVRSHARHESFARYCHTSTDQRSWIVQSRYSWIDFIISRAPDAGPPEAPKYEYLDKTRRDSINPALLRWFPFPPIDAQHLTFPRYPADVRRLVLAYWLLLLPTLPLPAIAVVRHCRRRLRERGNLCPTCGYDLRASPERCPECGTPRAASTTTVAACGIMGGHPFKDSK